jgi:signal peptidase I
VVALLSALLLANLWFDSYSIPPEARGMGVTVQPGDRIVARSIDGADAKRGDIVVFDTPADVEALAGEPYPSVRISRVVGLAGEVVAAREGHLVVDGDVVDEPYLARGVITESFAEARVPFGHVYVLSDNRSDAVDSRVFGPIPEESISARVVLRFWPPSRWGGPDGS